MILEKDDFQDVVTGADAELGFEIDTESDIIFDILRNKMYKDKIGSICREVASNSRDANREAGSDKPVEISILSPNKLLSMGHLSISFKDYGKGIPPNKMADVYVKYGASDKRDSNALTGGFGLGAKTPFAYNDTFTVITIADYAEPIIEKYITKVPDEVSDEGDVITYKKVEKERVIGHHPIARKKYTYTAMIDSSGKGKMILFDSKETTEETGTNVIVPINEDEDRWKFEKDSLKYTKTWGDEVVYKNFLFDQKDFEIAYENDSFVIYKTEDYLNYNIEMLVDGIPYPLDTDIANIQDTIGRVNSNYLTVLKFDTGDLSISATRESVQYDDKTVKAIQERHNEVVDTLDDLLENHLEEQESYLDACIFHYYVNRKSSEETNPPAKTGALIAHSRSTGFKFKDKTWRGIKTTDKFLFKHHTLFRVTLKGQKNNYEPIKTFFFSKDNLDKKLFYGDTRKNSKRNANLWEDGEEEFFILKPDDSEDREGIEEFMDFVFKFDIDYDLYSNLEPIKSYTAKGTYVKKSFVLLNTREYDRWSFSKGKIKLDRKEFVTTSGDDLSKAVYATTESLAHGYFGHYRSKASFLEDLGYKVLIVREQDYNNWFSNTEMQPLIEVYKEEYDKYEKKVLSEKKEKVKKHLIYKTVHEYVNKNYLDLVEEYLPKVCSLAEFSKDVTTKDIDIVKKELKFDFSGLNNKIKRIFEERFPLIRSMLRSSWSSDVNRPIIEKYIKQVNFYYDS